MPETVCTAKGTAFWNLDQERIFPVQSMTAFTKAVLAAAVIVRYLADDDTEDDYATCGRETVEVLCETMKKILQSGADHILPSPGMYDIQSAVL